MSTLHIIEPRQAQVKNALPAHSLLFIFASSTPYRNYDVEYPFRQNSDFFYLTQEELSPAIWVLSKTDERSRRVLFYTPKPESEQRWVGIDHSLEELSANGAWDSIEPRESWLSWLEKQIPSAKHIYIPFQFLPKMPNVFWKVIKRAAAKHNRRGGQPPTLHDTYEILAPLRQIKSPGEIAAMRKAADISANAHLYVMQHAHADMSEVQIAGMFEAQCRAAGARNLAYNTIVAAGASATVLHYTPADIKPSSSDMVLMDAGCEWNYLASDITRVFPIAKTFSSAQKDIYALVLGVQKKIISLVRPGIRHKHLQEQTIKLITQGLVDLGVLKGSPDQLIESKAYEEYYYHGVSHFLGMDVHDTGPYQDESGESVLLKPGMTLTIEPGVYFFKKGGKYPGIGVRIEDDVLVTKEGHEILTSGAPKEISDIEELRG